MKNAINLLFLLVFVFSCKNKDYNKEYYPNGNIKLKVSINENGDKHGVYEEYFVTGELKTRMNYYDGKVLDTIISYFKNGRIREKGLVNDIGLKINWWSSYDSLGNLKNKKEYWIINDSMHVNQNIYYKINGIVDNDRSSFFTLEVPDTIRMGRNIGKLKYNSNFNPENREILGIVIDNEYSEGQIKKDSFGNGTDSPSFGIFAHKSGLKIIKGHTVETLVFNNNKKADSTVIKIAKHKKYFKKEVYVKDTISK